MQGSVALFVCHQGVYLTCIRHRWLPQRTALWRASRSGTADVSGRITTLDAFAEIILMSEHCNALPGMEIYASGGNQKEVPDWYVGYLPSLDSVVAVHQGTTMTNLESDFVSSLRDGITSVIDCSMTQIDINLFFTTLSSTYFPRTPHGVRVHAGFAAAHARTATDILQTVKKVMALKNTTKVTAVGHSLGAALALLGTLFLCRLVSVD